MNIEGGPLRPRIIGISGGTGSGKTTLATALAFALGSKQVCFLGLDSYYLDRGNFDTNERALLNYDEPAAIDHNLLLDHLKQLIKGSPINKPIYSFETHRRSWQTEDVAPVPFIIVEGLFTFCYREIRDLLDLKVFVHADADLRLARRMRRDVLERGRSADSVLEQYLASVRPMHQLYIEPCREFADLVLSNNGDDTQRFVTESIQTITEFVQILQLNVSLA